MYLICFFKWNLRVWSNFVKPHVKGIVICFIPGSLHFFQEQIFSPLQELWNNKLPLYLNICHAVNVLKAHKIKLFQPELFNIIPWKSLFHTLKQGRQAHISLMVHRPLGSLLFSRWTVKDHRNWMIWQKTLCPSALFVSIWFIYVSLLITKANNIHLPY